jgi:GcrA cell cycle regulator
MSGYNFCMNWSGEDLAHLKKLWASGQSAAQIARRLGHSRNAVCAKLTRLGMKRGHKPPTAKPRIMAAPKRRTSVAACTRPESKVMSRRKPLARQPKEVSKRQLYAMLAEAVENTR